jgi:endonuclease I
MNWIDSTQKILNKYMKKWSISLAITEMQIKLHWNSISPESDWLVSRKTTVNPGKDMGKRNPIHCS